MVTVVNIHFYDRWAFAAVIVALAVVVILVTAI